MVRGRQPDCAQTATLEDVRVDHRCADVAVAEQLRNGVDIRQIQEYLGRANVETTMIYTYIVKELRNPARSPLDVLHARNARRPDA
jgi:site-specific recombinase XerC